MEGRQLFEDVLAFTNQRANLVVELVQSAGLDLVTELGELVSEINDYLLKLLVLLLF